MNIWDWLDRRRAKVEAAGHDFSIFDRLPDLAVDGQWRAQEPLVEHAIAIARAHDDAWLELFARHWQLQAIVLGASDCRRGFDLVVQAQALAASEAARDCPQAVCCTQDLSLVFARMDPLGYAGERAAAAEAMLERINPSWGCWVCLNIELGEALADAGAADRLEGQLERARWQCRTAKGDAEPQTFVLASLAALLARQRGAFDEAVAQSERALDRAPTPLHSAAVTARLLETLAAAGDWDGVAQRLARPVPRMDEFVETHEALAALARRGHLNGAEVLERHRARLAALDGMDNFHATAVLAALAAERAQALDLAEEAGRWRRVAEENRARLRRPKVVDRHLDRISGG